MSEIPNKNELQTQIEMLTDAVAQAELSRPDGRTQLLGQKYVNDGVVNHIKGADMLLVGPRYFKKAFASWEDEAISPRDRLVDAYIGCVAYDQSDLATRALDLLVDNYGYNEDIEKQFAKEIGGTIREESVACQVVNLLGTTGSDHKTKVTRLKASQHELFSRRPAEPAETKELGRTAIAAEVIVEQPQLAQVIAFPRLSSLPNIA